jgi:hypothetical protein
MVNTSKPSQRVIGLTSGGLNPWALPELQDAHAI